MIGSLSNDVFNDARKTGSSVFAFSRHDFDSFFRGQIVCTRVKTRSNSNLVASRHIKREKISLPVDVRY